MAGGCRDCSRCTETAMTGFVKAPFRLVALVWRIPLWSLKKKCPVCNHLMTRHRMIEGKFAD